MICRVQWQAGEPERKCRVNMERLPLGTAENSEHFEVRFVFWDVLPCKIIVDRRFRCAYCLHHQGWVSLTRKDRGYIEVQWTGLTNREWGSTYLWNVGRQYSPPWELEISHFEISFSPPPYIPPQFPGMRTCNTILFMNLHIHISSYCSFNDAVTISYYSPGVATTRIAQDTFNNVLVWETKYFIWVLSTNTNTSLNTQKTLSRRRK
jgi:hypothetical protein